MDTLSKLKHYFRHSDVELAFLYGSVAKGREIGESDVDIAIYVHDKSKEDSIWHKSQEILGKEVDLISLQNAPATLVSSIFKTGIPLMIKNKKLYWKLYLEKTLEAEDFDEFALSYWKISNRSASLSPEDRTRLIERVDFLKAEMLELEAIKKITAKEYEDDKLKRRNLERWTENIINALIDIAKIILAAEKKEMQKTYEIALVKFGILAGLSKEQSEDFSKSARLRNLLAHEYLDILYKKIQDFINDFPKSYKTILTFLEKYFNNGKK